jgi:hypothetical protein
MKGYENKFLHRKNNQHAECLVINYFDHRFTATFRRLFHITLNIAGARNLKLAAYPTSAHRTHECRQSEASIPCEREHIINTYAKN